MATSRLIDSEEQLDDLLSEPTAKDIEALQKLDSDILILGVGGKMGPSLAVRAKRALQASGSNRRIIAVSRFTDPKQAACLQARGVEPVHADLLKPESYANLPDADHIIHMVARKFGTSGEESMTWVTNALIPGLVGYRYRQSKILTWSTGNVYPLFPASSIGPDETAQPGPIGEYAQSALARERVFEYFARTYQTPLAILRLNYAVELRYGVLVDIATKVFDDKPIDLSMGSVNLIWQGDANSICLRSLSHCNSIPFVLNVTSRMSYQVRWIAEQFGIALGVAPRFEKQETNLALLSNAAKCEELFGAPGIGIDQMILWVAKWLQSGGNLLNKPTHFQVKDGRF